MRCSEFLEQYSAYRDGLLTDAVQREGLSHHLRSCPRCMRYDALVARGVMALQACDLEPSRAFRRRLQGRLTAQAVAVREPTAPAPAAVLVGLFVVGAVALLLWELAATSPPAPVAATAPEPPLPVVVANPGVPFVTFVPLSVPPFEAAPAPGDRPLGAWATLSR